MKRIEHVLGSIKNLYRPDHLVYFDSESWVRKPQPSFRDQSRPEERYHSEHVPRLIVGEAWSRGADGKVSEVRRWEMAAKDSSPDRICDDFWKAVETFVHEMTPEGKRKSRVVIMAHNAGYDIIATGAIPRLAKMGWKMEVLYEKGLVYILRFSKNKRSICVLSSTNFWSTTLAKLGKTFGVEKLDTDSQTEDETELLTYCRRDVEVLRTSMNWLIDYLYDNDLGPFAETISSVAFKSYRHRYMNHSIEIHIDPIAMALERAAYAGGRTEAFQLGPLEDPIYKLDVTSLYPYNMRIHRYPTKLVETRNDWDVPALQGALDRDALVIAEVEIDIAEPCVPLKSNKLVFPIGRFKTTLCSPELRLVFEHGAVLSVGGVAVYEGAPIFDAYVDEMSEARVEAKKSKDAARDQLYKNLQNNLYGKFGQMREEWVRLGDCPPDEAGAEKIMMDGREVTLNKYGGGIWMLSGVKQESYNSFPAIAAFVTSYSRAYLWTLMRTAGERHYFYGDTDSLFASETGHARLVAAGYVDDVRLGALKVEAIGHNVVIRGAKAYQFDAEEKFKGVPKRAVAVREDGSRVVTADGQPAREYDVFPKTKTFLHEGSLARFHNIRVIKKETVDYTKGKILTDGRVRPWKMPEEAEEAGVMLAPPAK